MSRAGLSERIGVPAPRLSSACSELLRAGLIRETTVAPAHGNGRGRPQTLLEVDLRGLAVAGVQYDHERVTAAVVDLAGAVRWQRRWDTGPDEPANRRLHRIVRATRDAIAGGPKASVKIVGIPKPAGAKLSKISVLADNAQRWWNPDLREYHVELTLDNTPANLKPGIGVQSEILVESVPDSVRASAERFCCCRNASSRSRMRFSAAKSGPAVSAR